MEQDPRVSYKWRIYRSGTGEPVSGIWALAYDEPSELDWFVGVLGSFDLALAAVEGHNSNMKGDHA
jgi:hypothetical protein